MKDEQALSTEIDAELAKELEGCSQPNWTAVAVRHAMTIMRQNTRISQLERELQASLAGEMVKSRGAQDARLEVGQLRASIRETDNALLAGAIEVRERDAEIKRLRAALKPFAEFADRTHRAPECLIITNGSPLAKPQLRMSDCYRAAEALAHEQSQNSIAEPTHPGMPKATGDSGAR